MIKAKRSLGKYRQIHIFRFNGTWEIRVRMAEKSDWIWMCRQHGIKELRARMLQQLSWTMVNKSIISNLFIYIRISFHFTLRVPIKAFSFCEMWMIQLTLLTRQLVMNRLLKFHSFHSTIYCDWLKINLIN